MRQANNLAALRSMVGIRAPSIMISESNSVSVTTPDGCLVFESIADFPAAIANHGQIYAVTGEVYVADAEGNITRLSSHDEGAWKPRSWNAYTGWGTEVDMLSGTRTRFRAPITRDWDADQQALARQQDEAIRRWESMPPKQRRERRPPPYVAKPMPAWMRRVRNATEDPTPVPEER